MKQPRNALGQNKPIAHARPARPVRVLLTGFGPFPGMPVNPTSTLIAAAAQRLKRGCMPLTVATEILPTEWAMLTRLPAVLAGHRPDVVVMTGVAGGARGARIERIAHPHADAALRDAAGAKLKVGSTAYPHGAVRRSEVDAARLKAALNRANLRVSLSDDPGRYLCNAGYLTALDWAARQAPRPPVVFVHVPPPRLAPGVRLSHLMDLVVETAETLARHAHRRGAVRPRTFAGDAEARRPPAHASGEELYFRSRRGS